MQPTYALHNSHILFTSQLYGSQKTYICIPTQNHVESVNPNPRVYAQQSSSVTYNINLSI